MAFKLLIKKSVSALAQGTLDLGELGLRYTLDGSNNVSGGQLYVGLGTTNTTGYFAIANADHTHALVNGLLKGGNLSYAPWGDDEHAAGRLYTGTTNPLNDTRLNYDGHFYATTLYSGGAQVLTAHQSIKTISTDNTAAQAAIENETIVGSGTIELHKIAKTGTYSDLIGTPTIGNGELTLTTGAGLTNTSVSISGGTGFTANKTDGSTYTVNVGPAISALSTIMTGTNLGFLKKTAADTYTLDTNTYLTAEADTLDSVTTRSATTSNNITVGDIAVNGGDITTDQATFNIGNVATTTQTINLGTAATGDTNTKTINIGTGGAAGSTTNITIGSTVAGTLTLNSPAVVIPGNLTVTGTVTTNNVETVSTTNGVIFEGSEADDNELTLIAGVLTGDRTITLPNDDGTVALTSQLVTTYLGLSDTPANFTTITGAGTPQTGAPYTYSNTLVGINLAGDALVNVASLDCGTW